MKINVKKEDKGQGGRERANKAEKGQMRKRTVK